MHYREHDKFHSYVSVLTDSTDNKCNNFGKLENGKETERKAKQIFLKQSALTGAFIQT